MALFSSSSYFSLMTLRFPLSPTGATWWGTQEIYSGEVTGCLLVKKRIPGSSRKKTFPGRISICSWISPSMFLHLQLSLPLCSGWKRRVLGPWEKETCESVHLQWLDPSRQSCVSTLKSPSVAKKPQAFSQHLSDGFAVVGHPFLGGPGESSCTRWWDVPPLSLVSLGEGISGPRWQGNFSKKKKNAYYSLSCKCYQ